MKRQSFENTAEITKTKEYPESPYLLCGLIAFKRPSSVHRHNEVCAYKANAELTLHVTKRSNKMIIYNLYWMSQPSHNVLCNM